jgi:hypothetical protein
MAARADVPRARVGSGLGEIRGLTFEAPSLGDVPFVGKTPRLRLPHLQGFMTRPLFTLPKVDDAHSTAVRRELLSTVLHPLPESVFQVISTTVLGNQTRQSGRRVFSSATYSCIRMSELQRVARNGDGANPPQVNVSTLPAAKRSNVV